MGNFKDDLLDGDVIIHWYQTSDQFFCQYKKDKKHGYSKWMQKHPTLEGMNIMKYEKYWFEDVDCGNDAEIFKMVVEGFIRP